MLQRESSMRKYVTKGESHEKICYICKESSMRKYVIKGE